jgi:hypothetical protein
MLQTVKTYNNVWEEIVMIYKLQYAISKQRKILHFNISKWCKQIIMQISLVEGQHVNYTYSRSEHNAIQL